MRGKKAKKRGRPIERHGGYTFLTQGRLPEHRGYIRAYLTAVREGLIRDLGPTERDLSTAQLIVIDRAIGKLGLLRCIEEHVRGTGVMRGHELAPALRKSYLAFSNGLRLDLQALETLRGKKAGEILDVQAYIAAKDQEREEGKKGPENATSHDIPEGE